MRPVRSIGEYCPQQLVYFTTPFFSLILMCQVPFFIFHSMSSQYPSAPKASEGSQCTHTLIL